MKRILAIFDLRRAAWSIGCILNFQEGLLIYRLEHKVKKIDIIFFHEPLKKRRDITADNYRFYLSRLLPMGFVNQYLGSFMYMDSFAAVEKYAKDNSSRYYIHPTIKDIVKSRKTFNSFYGKTLAFYNKKGYIPRLSCSDAMVMWARSFIKENIKPCSPVVVHLRNCSIPSFIEGGARNSFLEAWLEFFRVCERDYQNIKFIVIGTVQEIDQRFRTLGNVIFSKDYATTAEQDCALIQTSLMYLGTGSGPLAMACYCGVPYIYFNVLGKPRYIPLLKERGLLHSAALQKLVWGKETKEIITKNFSEIFNQIDIRGWEREFNSMDISKLDHKENAKWPNEL